MKSKFIKGLREVQSKYDTFFIDLWGVIHNGIELYPNAIRVLENLNELNKRFVLMSNAPRPSKNVEKFLLKLKINKSLIKNIFTSGEAALNSLRSNLYGKYFLKCRRFPLHHSRRELVEDLNNIVWPNFCLNKEKPVVRKPYPLMR